ncbi:DUF6286 domain-containing protein [Streptomyces alkaliterrae]|uniref:DUF6286 domain-containing protein n=1 Tax=Streptomyces alkaliterrae TaxID=2213162 RepID=UPI002B1FCDEB|nr:DUF6286 domain-containing protein [Streptomyces alkaliterrae]
MSEDATRPEAVRAGAGEPEPPRLTKSDDPVTADDADDGREHPGREQPPTASYQRLQQGRPDDGGGRFWSVRRAPALIVGLLLLAGTALLLYDVALVRAGRRGGAWRRELAADLATRRLDDPVVVVCAAAAVLLGLWLLVLALTPGLRNLLTMHGEPDLRAGLERGAAALVLRDRAMEVPGVRSVRVSVRRRRVRVRAESHFRDVDTVRAETEEALADGMASLGLTRPPRLAVQVRRPVKR